MALSLVSSGEESMEADIEDLKKQRIEKQRVIDRLTGRLTASRVSDAATRLLMAVERNSMALAKAVQCSKSRQGTLGIFAFSMCLE